MIGHQIKNFTHKLHVPLKIKTYRRHKPRHYNIRTLYSRSDAANFCKDIGVLGESGVGD